MIQHFILTRFNIRIWTQDKNGRAVRTTDWLKHRFDVFEKYCLPSIASQTCKDFEWIVLFDSKTPAEYKERIEGFKAVCPQFIPVFVDPSMGRYFARIFRASVVERVHADKVLTTYLDNDDALSVNFVEDIQRRAADMPDGTFVFYSDVFQFFKELGLMLHVRNTRNHFVSVVEAGSRGTLKTIFGYGSHYYIDRIPDAHIEYIEDCPLWCEVVHERNMCNDAFYLWGIKPVRDSEAMRRDFGVDVDCKCTLPLLAFRFVPRYIKTFFWRARRKIFGQKW